MKKRLWLLAFALTGAACGDSTEPRVPTTLAVEPASVELHIGDTTKVQATVQDQHGRPFSEPPQGFEITWSTSAQNVASVSAGSIAGGSIGQATITARAGSLAPAQVEVRVVPRSYTGRLDFGFSGDRSGSFSVNSTFLFDPRPDAGPSTNDWAFAFFDSEYGSQDIWGQRLRADGRIDFVWFWVMGRVTSAGARAVDDAVFVFGWHPATQEFDLYLATGGTVTFSAATPQRLQGSFQIPMTHDVTGAALTLQNGTFDVPIVREFDPSAQSVGSAGGAAPLAPAPDAAARLPAALAERVQSRRTRPGAP